MKEKRMKLIFNRKLISIISILLSMLLAQLFFGSILGPFILNYIPRNALYSTVAGVTYSLFVGMTLMGLIRVGYVKIQYG